MNRLPILIVCLLLTEINFAQILYDGNQNYYDFLNQVQEEVEVKGANSSVLKKLMRQDYIYQDRLFPSGDLSVYQKELKDALTKLSKDKTTLRSNLPEWQAMGQEQIRSLKTGGIFGNGRVSFIKFHPKDLNTLYVGSPTGCVWWSRNNGEDWEIFSEDLPCRGYSDMAFSGIDGSTIYLLTGDYDGKNSSCHGIYKSEDGGSSWERLEGPAVFHAEQIRTHPSRENWVYVSTDAGFFYSTDGGQQWEMPGGITGFASDLEFHTSNDSILYVLENKVLKVSYDNGLQFDSLYDFTATGGARMKLAVHPLYPSDLYVSVASVSIFIGGAGPLSTKSKGTFYSQDNGQTFELIAGSDELLCTQANYNMVFDIYPQQEQRLVNGWVKLYLNDPDDGSWKDIHIGNTVHVDHHALAFDPKNPDCILIGNDGGVYRSCDFGNSWENISGNLSLTQVYNLGLSQTCEDWTLMGTQDNGTSILRQGEWQLFWGGDGFACGFSAESNDIAYWSLQNQIAYRTDHFFALLDSIAQAGTQGVPVSSIRPVYFGEFKTRFFISPLQPGLLLYPTDEGVYRSVNYGEDWEKVAADEFVSTVAFSETNADYVAFANRSFSWQGVGFVDSLTVQYSIDGGASWNQSQLNHPVIDSLPVSPVLSAITFDSEDPRRIWVAANRNNHHRVYHTPDGGRTWEENSKGLPNIQLNDILYQPYSEDALYLATDLGVYYLDNSLSEWIPFNEGLPLTLFSQLAISKVSEKLRVSSYGSGIWETDLYAPAQRPPFSNFACETRAICQGDILEWSHTSTFAPDSVYWIFEGGTPEISTTDNPEIQYQQAGTFEVTLVSINEYGRDTLVRKGLVEVAPLEVTIEVTTINDSTFLLGASSIYDHYLWSTGDTTQQISVTESGWYTLQAYNSIACLATDSVYIDLVTAITSPRKQENSCKVYPNPNRGVFMIECLDHKISFYRLYNLLGQATSYGPLASFAFRLEAEKGVYLLELYDDEGQLMEREKIVVLE